MSEAKKEMRTMTLTPEEVTFLAARAADDESHADGLDWITRMLMMHEAELRKRWFSEPVVRLHNGKKQFTPAVLPNAFGLSLGPHLLYVAPLKEPQ